jgi:hypothetical protein
VNAPLVAAAFLIAVPIAYLAWSARLILMGLVLLPSAI